MIIKEKYGIFGKRKSKNIKQTAKYYNQNKYQQERRKNAENIVCCIILFSD